MTEAKKEVTSLRSYLSQDGVKAEIAKALPDICTPDRFMRVMLTTLTKTPKLNDCDRLSLMSALMDCAQLGIEPDGRRAHLIPFGKNVQLIIDYKGLVELAMRSGKISNIHADKVCENDFFEADTGAVVHKINYKEPRGNVYAYYAKATFKDGSTKSEVMTLEEVMAIKARSRSGGSEHSPWSTDPNEMGKKTVFRRLSKWLPLSPEEAQVIQKVEENEFTFNMPKAPQEVKTEVSDLFDEGE